MPTVVRVRKELSADGSHWHVAGVCTVEGSHFSRGQVATRIDSGEAWYSRGGGLDVKIRTIGACPMQPCSAIPYLTTAPDHTAANNLENLAPC